MKKGESISMSVIIIAAIALLVLIVLAVLVLRSSNSISNGTGCQGLGGICQDPEGDGQQCGEGYSYNFANSDKRGGCQTGQVCCVRTINPVESE